jgi:hypothetical protein
MKRDLAKHGDAFKREAERLIAELAHGCVIRCDEAGTFYLMDEDCETGGRVLAKTLMAYCMAADWLERRGDRLVLSEAGRSRLRRGKHEDDAYRIQHQLRRVGRREIDGTSRAVATNDAESPLGWLKSRKDRNGRPLLSEPQFAAGERLRADYWFAHLSPRVTSNWSALAPSERTRRGAPSSAAALRDEVIAAKERVLRALMAVGPEVSGVLVDVCCELKGLEEAEKENGWPQRAGKVVLQIALTRLAKHYGLIEDDKQAPARRKLRHWGQENYRPTLEAWKTENDGEQEA